VSILFTPALYVTPVFPPAAQNPVPSEITDLGFVALNDDVVSTGKVGDPAAFSETTTLLIVELATLVIFVALGGANL
jgi:hypothetical protein